MSDDLAYGDIPQRWDRDRFERFSKGGPPRFDEEIRIRETSRPGRRDVTIIDRRDEGNVEERDRFREEDVFVRTRPRRRTDRELFGDVDPRELADLSLTTYRRGSSRPGLLRRQSSLDTFDRRPPRYERDEFRIAVPPAPRRPDRGRPDEYREVEITRERSVRRASPSRSEHQSVRSRKSRPRTRASSSSSSSSEEVTEVIEERIRQGLDDVQRKLKKGKTRMPKRLVRREAIMDLGYPFDEEEFFFVLRVALEKDQIDEVIQISQTYKNKGAKSETILQIDEKSSGPRRGEREEIIRTEWINPPSDAGRSRRSRSARPPSPSSYSNSERYQSPVRTVRLERSPSRARSPAVFFEQRRTVVERAPSPQPFRPADIFNDRYVDNRRVIIEQRPGPALHTHGGTLVVREPEHKSNRDILAEISRLERDRRVSRLERDLADSQRVAVEIVKPQRHHSDDEDDNKEITLVRKGRPILVENFGDDRPTRGQSRLARDRARSRARSRANSRGVPIAVLTLPS